MAEPTKIEPQKQNVQDHTEVYGLFFQNFKGAALALGGL